MALKNKLFFGSPLNIFSNFHHREGRIEELKSLKEGCETRDVSITTNQDADIPYGSNKSSLTFHCVLPGPSSN